ncbi:hypothetical protein COO72_00920 [Bifidobacterium callitrichos]|nr:hypothetical protein COO72_00920 [Bifidobacterium callitrichos]
MKLIAMKFRGFGPYRNEYAIDFAALTRGHMFLIEGQTGAGKTTILDCLSFALYGTISGSDSLIAAGDRQRVRSRFLTDERVETYVDLIFRSGDDYYEVRRTPKYEQPKARGEGTTTHNASAKLMRLDRGIGALAEKRVNDPGRFFDYAEQAGHAEAMSTRADEVGEEIQRLIGLDRRQFARTIMLAQGQFAMFLSMKPEDRTELVKDLFGAEVYERIQDRLVERRKTMQGETDQAASTLVGGIAAARRTAADILERGAAPSDDDTSGAESGVDAGTSDDGGLDTGPLSNERWGLDRDDDGRLAFPAHESDEIAAALHRTVDDVDTACDKLIDDCGKASAQAKAALASARDRHDAALALCDAAQRERRDVLALRELRGRDGSIDESRRNLERAAAAQPLIDLDRELASLTAKRDLLGKEADRLHSQLDELPARDDLEAEHDQALHDAADAQAARGDLDRAGEHERLLDAVDHARQGHDHAKTELGAARTSLEQAKQALDALPAAQDVDRRLRDIAERLGGEEGLRKELALAEQALGHAVKAERLEQRIPELERERQQAEDAQAEAEHTLRTVRNDIAQSGAAQYAAQLQDGLPCPVCGSLDHPHPAVEPDTQRKADELKELEQRVENKRDAAEQARKDVGDAQRDLDSHREQCGRRSVEQSRAYVKEITDRLEALETLHNRQGELEESRKAIATAEQSAQTAGQHLATAQTREAETLKALTNAERQAAGHTRESIEAERENARIRLERAESQQRKADQLKQAIAERDQLDRQCAEKRTQARTAAQAVDEAAGKLDEALSDSVFATVREAEDAGLSEDERDGLRDAIQRHDDAVRTAQANLTRSREDLRGRVEAVAGENRRALGLPDPTVPTISAYSDDGEPTPLGAVIAAIDTAALRSAVDDAERSAAEADRRAGTLDALHDSWRMQVAAMDAAVDRWMAKVDAFEPVRRMADLANADRGTLAERRMTLITFAITERFRDVLDRANELLADIRGGVYELRLDESGSAPANAKTGLSITVFDRRTEQERNPGTLSGGETFFVSLALALGLADVIQAENGGVAMDTLFVDEGFGTLSEDYLADVMGMLRRICATRDIGIISHVDWLKDQINERITVGRVTPNGESRLEVTA